jgi:hypothetical protein|tara:strand:- start:1361 stop:1699 length:339 start_codon:yes stop_codon:yes gene_type:complete
LGFISCIDIIISDTLLPEDVKVVSEDYELFDGRSLVFSAEKGLWFAKPPSSLSGRKVYNYKDLNSKKGIVEGEYKIDHEHYIVIRLDGDILIKVPKEVFFNVTQFIDDHREH